MFGPRKILVRKKGSPAGVGATTTECASFGSASTGRGITNDLEIAGELRKNIPACMLAHMLARVLAHMLAHMRACMPAYMLACIPACTPAYIPAHIPACIPAYTLVHTLV